MKHAPHGDGSVFKLNNPARKKAWVAQVTFEGGKKRQTYHATRKEALAAKRKMLHELEQGTLITAKQQTMKDYLEQWLQAKRLELKDGTYEYYRKYAARYILPTLGHIPLQKLTDGHIQDLYATLLKRISASTVRMVHRILRGALNAAVKSRKIVVNPAVQVTLPKQEHHELAYLTIDEAQHLLHVARGHSLECLLTLAITTGMRQGEMLALRWSDIDLAKKTVRVVRSLSYRDPDGDGFVFKETEPKTTSSKRTIPLPECVIAALKAHRIQQLETRLREPSWRNGDLIFTNDEGGYAWPVTIRDQLRKLLRSAELPAIRFHDLRHTTATTLLSLGVNPKVVQEWLGHSSISITLGTYGHITESMRGQARDRLNELFSAL